MKQKIIFSLPGNEALAEQIAAGIHAETGICIHRQFPDGETYLRIESDVREREAVVVCTLHKPDDKLLPLLFLCQLLRDMGAASVCLVTPYLAYMRQDTRFNPGEAVTSEYFARLLSGAIDRLITIDPHLHRRNSMQEIYSVPCDVLHAAGVISAWIRENIPQALLIGPDSESQQWVAEVARNAGAPYIVLEKIRHGDRDVEVSVPDVEKYKDYTPVLVDDIISTARTMIETVGHILKAGMKPPICIGVHAVFAGDAFRDLLASGAGRVITCATIPHESNGIEVAEMMISALESVPAVVL